MYGPPGAGKSTWAQAETGARVIDLDQLVTENTSAVAVGGMEASSRGQWDEALVITERALVNGERVIVDYVAVQAFYRMELRQLARRVGVPAHLVVFDAPLEVCLTRNASRVGQKRLPDAWVKRLHAQFLAGRERVVAEPWSSVDVRDAPSQSLYAGVTRARLAGE